MQQFIDFKQQARVRFEQLWVRLIAGLISARQAGGCVQALESLLAVGATFASKKILAKK